MELMNQAELTIALLVEQGVADQWRQNQTWLLVAQAMQLAQVQLKNPNQLVGGVDLINIDFV